MINIIYVLTVLLVMGMHILLYKKEEKQNILNWIIISIIILLGYNICICVILSLIKIKSTLLTLTLINGIVICGFVFKIYKDKKIQKYYINKNDIIPVIIIVIMFFCVVIKQYGIPFNIKYAITDGSTHYWVADEFYNYSILLYEENSDVMGYFGEEGFMPGAYINTGLLFKIFSPIVEEIDFYKLFIIFDSSMWCLSGLLMYILLSNIKGRKNSNILQLIISIIYMLGYPLNTLISGFSYLQVGLNFILCIIIVKNLKIDERYKDILFFIVDFGLMFSYYYFAPVVFLTIFIQKIIEIKKKDEKIFTTKNILSIVISLIIPGLFGVMYFIVFRIINNGTESFKFYTDAINIPGSIYQNLIMNFILFLIISIYYIKKCIENKKIEMPNVFLTLSTIFIIILFVGMKTGKVSEYYYYKVYYMYWVPLIVVSYKAIDLLLEKNKNLTYIGISVYCIGIVVSVFCNKSLLFYDIYQKNFQEIKDDYNFVTNGELEVLKYYNENINSESGIDPNTYIYEIELEARARWIYAITKNPYIFIGAQWNEFPVDIQQFLDSEKNYCIILKQDNCEEIFKNLNNTEKIKILFQNEEGAVVEKIK